MHFVLLPSSRSYMARVPHVHHVDGQHIEPANDAVAGLVELKLRLHVKEDPATVA